MTFHEDACTHFRLVGRPRPAWRTPQFGALGAVAMHWSLSPETPTVVSIPTGSGKTALAMAAPFLLEEPPTRILVVVPTRALREQMTANFQNCAVLRRVGALPPESDFDSNPTVVEITGRVRDWGSLESADVVVGLPDSISPAYYEAEAKPPPDLFDLVVIDEAHHAPAPTWLNILEHFQARAVLLTATPVRRDGKRIPGELVFHYPLRRALDEGLYQSVTPKLLELQDPADRTEADAAIASAASEASRSAGHQSSVLLVRASSISRLQSLKEVYRAEGVALTLLHNRLGAQVQQQIREGLLSGAIRAVGVVGMLGEGFDLPSLRIVAYHDKHKSLPATIQLIGRLARVHPSFPQSSILITARDIDVFPELRGVVRDLYDEDADWADVLPGIIDDQIQREREDRAYANAFGGVHAQVLPDRLQPLQRSIVYEIADTTWRPTFSGGTIPPQLIVGESLGGGRIVYSGVEPNGETLVIALQHTSQPRWSSDPGLVETTFALHLISFRASPRTDQPGLLFFNTSDQSTHTELREILDLEEVAQPASPERIGQYLDGLERRSVSAVGMRSTNAANRGTTAYKNHLGASVDRGLRAIDMTRNALGHVNIQITDGYGSSNAGAALEKAKLWVTRYAPLRGFDEWVDQTAALLWFARTSMSGPLLPALNRGTTLLDWPPVAALAAESHPALLGLGFEAVTGDGELVSFEDIELYVSEDPLDLLDGSPQTTGLPIVAIRHNRDAGAEEVLWQGHMRIDGTFTGADLLVRRGHGATTSIVELFNEFPPTVYFLDGTTVVGHVAYLLNRTGQLIDPDEIVPVDWTGVDITAETDQTALAHGTGEKSVHKGLIEWLSAQPRRGINRWIVFNDGSGEIADVLVIEPLFTGEVSLGLWHAKASTSREAGLRINEVQVVVAQAIRSRRWFPSLSLWSELGERLRERRNPKAVIVGEGDAPALLDQYLGIAPPPDEDFRTWIQRPPIIRGRIGVVQPGLSKARALAERNDGTESGVCQLIMVLDDIATPEGFEIRIVGSS
ncbi:MAG TPA: DEAD/DEAH box helicase family protein [Dehalococcoidia bacterium]|nr:DEAD/DEAH box helicase family protein [Dehalococcoidia bacterium]